MSQHSHLYNSRQWRKKRALQLQGEPLCRYCMRMGKITAACVADHVEPHRGDLVKFWSGILQSLCKLCHDSVKQREESGQGPIGHDLTGAPLDPTHPWHDAGARR